LYRRGLIDSPLEGEGFELFVPRHGRLRCRGLQLVGWEAVTDILSRKFKSNLNQKPADKISEAFLETIWDNAKYPRKCGLEVAQHCGTWCLQPRRSRANLRGTIAVRVGD